MTDDSPLDRAFSDLLARLSEHHDLAKLDVERACSEMETKKVRRAALRYAEELADQGWGGVFGHLFPEGYEQDLQDADLPGAPDLEIANSPAPREVHTRWSLRGRWDFTCPGGIDLTLDSDAREVLSTLADRLFPNGIEVARAGEQWTLLPVDTTLADLEGPLIYRNLYIDP